MVWCVYHALPWSHSTVFLDPARLIICIIVHAYDGEIMEVLPPWWNLVLSWHLSRKKYRFWRKQRPRNLTFQEQRGRWKSWYAECYRYEIAGIPHSILISCTASAVMTSGRNTTVFIWPCQSLYTNAPVDGGVACLVCSLWFGTSAVRIECLAKFTNWYLDSSWAPSANSHSASRTMLLSPLGLIVAKSDPFTTRRKEANHNPNFPRDKRTSSKDTIREWRFPCATQ
jgi:hypothetical protein